MYKPVFNKRKPLVFRHFQRKGYSLFACLGREVVISVLSVATLSASKAASISDETWRADSAKTTKEVWLGDVGVTGQRAPLTQSRAARMVTVLSHDDIAQAPVQSVNDLLKYAVGVDVRQRGAAGTQTDISIRGGTQEQIMVLLNGVNICDPQTGHNVFDLPVQPQDILRIEVLEGPAGRVYGTSSLVGAINIVTKAPTGPDRSGEAIVEGGSFGYAKAALRAPLPSLATSAGGTLAVGSVSASYARSDGYSRSQAGRLNTGMSASKAFYQGGYEDDLVRIRWHAGLADKGWGSGTFYASPAWHADEQYEHTTKLFTALHAETRRGPVYMSPTVYWNRYSDRYEGYHGQPSKMPYNYNRCDVYGLSLNTFFDWVAGRTAVGAELRCEDLLSGNLGEPLYKTHHIGGTDRDYTLGLNRTNMSAHVEHNVLLPHLTISAGLVAMKSTQSAAGWGAYPGIDVSWDAYSRPADHTRLRLSASLNTSMRLPSFTEMYYRLKGYAADPHLKPERMAAAEIGAQLLTDRLSAKAVAFAHRGRDMIDWIMDTRQGAEAHWESVNHTRLNAVGAEATVGLRLDKMMPAQKVLRAFDLSYCYTHQDKKLESHVVSQYALEYLRHKLVARLQAHVWRHLDATLHMRWQDRTGSYTTFDGQVRDYRPYALLDARATWTEQRWRIYAEVNNLTDNRTYVDYGNVPQPGAWFTVGAAIGF